MTRRFSVGELVVATHNKGKLAEMAPMLEKFGVTLIAAGDLGLEAPEETGTTFIDNALLKARYVANATGKIALADDSGLCVEALDGAPGVYSADWAETENGRDFSHACEQVHIKMDDTKNTAAAFVSVVVLCWPDGHHEIAEGRAEGNITWPPRGKQGHGYDPIFLPAGHAHTFAEMSFDEKNAISHRARAMQGIIEKCFR